MSTAKKKELPCKVKVEEVLADFFVKKMEKTDDTSVTSASVKPKKHKKKSKKKRDRSSSSSSRCRDSSRYQETESSPHRGQSNRTTSKHRKKKSKHRSRSSQRSSGKKKENKYESDSDGSISEEWVESTVSVPPLIEDTTSHSERQVDNTITDGLCTVSEDVTFKTDLSAINTPDSERKTCSDFESYVSEPNTHQEIECSKTESITDSSVENNSVFGPANHVNNSDHSDIYSRQSLPNCTTESLNFNVSISSSQAALSKNTEHETKESIKIPHAHAGSSWDSQTPKHGDSSIIQADKASVIVNSTVVKEEPALKQKESLETSVKNVSTSKSKRHHSSYEGRNEEKHRSSSSRHSSNRSERDRSSHHRRDSSFSERRRKRSRSRSRESPRRSHSSSAHGGKPIDKEKLLEVARKNALEMMEKGTLPEGIKTEILKKSHLKVALKAGGKSVKELTDFCRELSSKENNSVLDEHVSLEENEGPFIHHPFKVKESSTIKLNIKNSLQLPVKSHAEKVKENARILSLQFPVSSGDEHRQKENGWVPVSKNESTTSQVTVQANQNTLTPVAAAAKDVSENLLSVVPVSIPPPPPPPPPSMTLQLHQLTPLNVTSSVYGIPAQPTIPMAVPTIPTHNYTWPSNMQASYPNNVQLWTNPLQVPGQFTGSTNAKVLSAEELCGPRPAWVKKDVFSKAAPVMGGKGLNLLQKMGWKPGEGLGKNKDGSLEPLLLDFKMDKKGLVSEEENRNRIKAQQTSVPCVLNKHPVSCLMEICSKKKWEPPLYTVIQESGPPHKKIFLFKVLVNNKEYQPAMTRSNKKQAKADAALLCLQSLNLLPPGYKM